MIDKEFLSADVGESSRVYKCWPHTAVYKKTSCSVISEHHSEN